MPAKTDYLENKLIDAFWRAQSSLVIGSVKLAWVATATTVTAPTFYLGLLNVLIRNNSQAFSLGDFTILADSSAVLHLMKCTTAGTTGSSYTPGAIANNATVNDGTVVWTDQYAALEAGTGLPAEFTGGSYARQGVTAGMTSAGFAGTQSAGSTTASTGTGGTTSNNATITFTNMPAGNAGVFAWYDASSAGNMLEYGILTSAPVPIASGATVSFAAGALTIREDD